MKLEIEIFKFGEKMPENNNNIILIDKKGNIRAKGTFYYDADEKSASLSIQFEEDEMDECFSIKKYYWAYAPKLDLINIKKDEKWKK